MQKFIVSDISSIPSRVFIEGQDAKHIHRVLRLSEGALLQLTDGAGMDYNARITRISKGKVETEIFEKSSSESESPLEITLCCGMLKDKKMDFIIKHVTQLGIKQWIPFYCERSVPVPNIEKANKRISRWQAIARESLKQCRRSFLPRISPPLAFSDLIDQDCEYDEKIAFWEKSTQRLDTLSADRGQKKIMILIGPEGGFSEEEIRQAEASGFTDYCLGPRILRAETASISACTLIQHIFGDI